MKTYEITAKVELDEGVLDNFKAFGSAVTDLFTGDDAGSSSASGTASTGTA